MCLWLFLHCMIFCVVLAAPGVHVRAHLTHHHDLRAMQDLVGELLRAHSFPAVCLCNIRLEW